MSYGKLFGRQFFEVEIDGVNYEFTCYTQSCGTHMRHICTKGCNDVTSHKYIRNDIVGKCIYYNRTWESFKYETALRSAINNIAPNNEVKEKLINKLIKGIQEEEQEKSEKFISDFTKTFNDLNEENKEHLRNGLGGNLIETQEQADAVLGVMKFMNIMQALES